MKFYLPRLPLHEEFRRAALFPEVESERKALAWENDRVREESRHLKNIFRIERRDYGMGQVYSYCLQLADYEVGQLAGGKGREFADYLAETMIREVVNSSMWRRK